MSRREGLIRHAMVEDFERVILEMSAAYERATGRPSRREVYEPIAYAFVLQHHCGCHGRELRDRVNAAYPETATRPGVTPEGTPQTEPQLNSTRN